MKVSIRALRSNGRVRKFVALGTLLIAPVERSESNPAWDNTVSIAMESAIGSLKMFVDYDYQFTVY